MVRCLATAVIFTGVMATAAAAQQTIGVSAVILERVDPGTADVHLQSVGSRLTVREATTKGPSSRLLRHTFVGTSQNDSASLPDSYRDGGLVPLAASRRSQGEDIVERRATVDRSDRITVTRVIASNS